MSLLYDDSVFTDGKYKGKTVAEVATVDKDYLVRYQSTTRSNFISDEVMQNLQRYTNVTKKVNQDINQARGA